MKTIAAPPHPDQPASSRAAALGRAALADLRAGRPDAAQRGFEQAIAIDPHYLPGLQALSATAWHQQRLDEALAYARRALALAPNAAASHHTVARLLSALGRPAEAAAAHRAGLHIAPDDPGACCELAMALQDSGDADGAERCLRAAMDQHPRDAGPHHRLGNLLLAGGRPDEAIACFDAALRVRPADPDLGIDRVEALRQAGRLQEAEQALRALAAAHPDRPDAQYNLGHLLAATGRPAEAIAAFRTALALQPGHADARNNLGCALRDADRLDEAETCLRQAVENCPDLPAPLHNLGAVLRDQGRLAEAEACFATVLRMAPDRPITRYNMATTLLLRGRLAEGWPLYEARWTAGDMPLRPFPQPRWAGDPIGSRTVLLHAEQGFGDTLQFCRFIPQAAATGRVILEVQPPLVPLVAASFPHIPTLAYGEGLPPFDVHCPLMSLPFTLGTATIPDTTPYLTPPPAARARWQARLAALPGLRVGLVWRGNQRKIARLRHRDMAPGHFEALAGIAGVSFVSLQKDAPDDARTRLGETLAWHDWTAELDDFGETAGLVAGLDLVIGVDTAMIHLAGALGRPAWLLNRFNSCWRWGAQGDQSAWYPALRQFRQTVLNDWTPVIERVRTALMDSASGTPGAPRLAYPAAFDIQPGGDNQGERAARHQQTVK